MTTVSHPAAHAAFWHERWTQNQIGFHEGTPNAQLVAHWNFDVERVLVPLCGKTADLSWLAERGHAVTGVELSPIACAAFFAERGLEPTRTDAGRFVEWACEGLRILQGDIFDLEEHFDAWFDRAALIALPADVRPRYLAHLRARAPRGLLVTLAYDQTRRDGPPFSVGDAEVLAGHPDAVRLDHFALPDERFADIGGATGSVFRVG